MAVATMPRRLVAGIDADLPRDAVLARLEGGNITQEQYDAWEAAQPKQAGPIDLAALAARLEALERENAALRAGGGSARVVAPSAAPVYWKKKGKQEYVQMVEVLGNHRPELLSVNVLRSIVASRAVIDAALEKFPLRTAANTRQSKSDN